MPGISFLYEEYKKDPSRVEKLLNSQLEISEKLDGSRLLAQKDEGNRILFFKRHDVPISKIDRTLSKYYEKGIYHFENLSDEKVSQMPDGWRFGMEYFPNLQPVTITYDRLPLNNLVLTDIQVKDPKDRTLEVISDKETLKKWSQILEVESPPIIFEGSLSDVQKRRILDFLNTPYSKLIERFKTESFTSFILNLLNPELKNSFMHSDTDKDIDGLIFRFGGKEAMRVSNPEIVEKKSQRKEEKPSDIYNLTLVILQEFLLSLDFNKIKLKEKKFEDRYIEFISQVFNKFLQSNTYKINFEKGVDFELPKFLTRAESDVNFKFVKDPETQKALDKSNTNRELFKILIASMRSHKKKASGFFSRDLISHHNQLVDKVADYVSSVKESEFFSFSEFKQLNRVYLNESLWQEEFGKERLEETEMIDISDVALPQEPVVSRDEPLSKPEIETPPSVNKPLEVLKKIFAPEEASPEKRKKKKTKKVCLMKGKFFPFHNGHSTVAKDVEDETGLKVFLVIMQKKSNFPQELHKAIIEEAIKNHSNIEGYVFSEGRSMREILRDLPSGVEVEGFAGSPDECEDAKLEMGSDFLTVPLTKHISSKSVIKKIREEDYDSYKKLVPKSLHNYFYKLKNELSEE